MSTINQLSAINSSEITGASLLPLYDNLNGDARKMSLTALLAWLNSNFARQDYLETILVVGDLFGENLPQDGFSRWVNIKPTTSITSGTIVLPAIGLATDGQELLFTTTYQIAALTLNGNGATVYGAPSVLAAEDKFTLRYSASGSSWHCVA